MADMRLNTAEINALLKRLAAILEQPGFSQVLLAIGRKIGVQAEQYGRAGYPPAPGGRPLPLFYTLGGKKSKFKSYRQQGWFFAALDKGTIKVPRVRTGFFGASLTSHAEVQDAGVLVSIGTNLDYAPYVIGPPTIQSHYHLQTGWEGLPKIERQHLPQFRQTAIDMLKYAVVQAMKGE